MGATGLQANSRDFGDYEGVQMKITEIPYIIPMNPIDTKIKQSSFEDELKKAMVKTNGTTDNYYILRDSCDNPSVHC